VSLAPATDKALHVTVITPAKSVMDTTATSVVVPAFDGELGVLPGHADLLALLGTGEMRLTTADGNTRRLALRGGFLQVNHNKITVLTPESAAPEELKPEALNAERDKLNAEKPTKLEERDALAVRREWLNARQRVLKTPGSSSSSH
jgi:F-type H+-transporting ATPase subunit epsilon